MSTFVDMAVSIPSPLEKLSFNHLTQEIWMKRDDLIHPVISGNKYRKLKNYLKNYLNSGKKEVVTVGGAFSNHLAATAYVCKELAIPSMGLVKYHEIDPYNPTMVFCDQHGMRLKPVGHSYNEEELLSIIGQDQYFIPEGGAGYYGELGVKDMVDEVLAEINPDYWLVSLGKGGTLKGMLNEIPPSQKVIAVSSFSKSEMLSVLEFKASELPDNLRLVDASFLGKFGQMKKPLIDFIGDFYAQFKVPLDPIYTSKMMYVLQDSLVRLTIPPKSKVVAIHTGGLQGWEGMKYRRPNMDFPHFS